MLLRLVFKEFSENKLKAIVLFFVAMAITITGLFWFAQRKMIYSSVDVFRAYGLEDSVIVFDDIFAQESELYARLNSIKGLDAVGQAEFCEYADYQYNLLLDETIYEENSKGNSFDLIKMPKLNYNPYTMVEGRPPENDNEIMISSNIKKISSEAINVQIGSELHNMVVEDYIDGEIRRTIIPTVRITGIFDLSNPMPLSASKTFQADDWSTEGTSDWVNEMYGYAFFTDIKDSEGNSLSAGHLSNTYMIVPADGYDTADVVKALYDRLGLTGYDLSGYTKYAESCHADDLMRFRALTILLSTIIVTMNISYCFINLSIKRKVMGIYYVFGFPWKRTVAMNAFINYFFIVLGFFAGLMLYLGQGQTIQQLSDGVYLFSFLNAFIVWMILTSAYFIVGLCFYYATLSKSPIDLLRKE